MRRISTALVTLVCILSSLVTAFGQSAPAAPSVTVPRLIQLAGTFQPVDGRPPAAVELLTVSIYAEADGGLPVWQERQSVTVEPTTGRFTLLLGASYPDGIPAEVFGAGQAQWMSLLFERLGEAEQPRVRIASVPYALKASDAETLGGLPASAYVRAPGGDATETKLGAPSAITSLEAPVTDAVVLPGTTNFLAKYVNGADVGNSAVYESGGMVGVGTTTPFDQVHVRFTNTNGAFTGLAVQNLGNTATSYSGMLFFDQNGALGQFQGFNNATHEYRINNIAAGGSINFMIGSSSKFLVTNTGDVQVAGNMTVNGNIGAKYQDVAEWVETSSPLEAGTVVIIDPTQPNRVLPAPKAYDTRVAGAVSRQPGVLLGERSDTKTMVAQSGRVRVKADAKYGAIRIGDLLVTSPTPGYAMRSRPVQFGPQALHRPGTLLGKALEALPNGKGEILVLLTLQ
jgi:hypothetical protein